MPFTTDSVEERRRDPQDVMVQVNVRIPYHYRAQLFEQARTEGVSFNRFVINALVRCYPPDRR